MKLKSIIPFLALTLIALQTIIAQEKISKAGIEEDITILKKNLEELHPDLYLYSPKEEIDNWFSNLNKKLKDSITSFEFYNLLAPLNGIIKNGHTNIAYPRFGDNFHFLPIQLYTYKSAFYIRKSLLKEYNDIEGTQILEINGIAINDIYNRLLKNFTRDGNNLSMPSDNLASLFGLDYTIVYGKQAEYTLTLRNQEGQFQITIPQTLLNTKIIKQFNEGNQSKPLSFEIKNNIARLTFPTFLTETLKEANYKELLEEAFKENKRY